MFSLEQKSSTHPVIMEIVSLAGGIPSNEILASKLLYPAICCYK